MYFFIDQMQKIKFLYLVQFFTLYYYLSTLKHPNYLKAFKEFTIPQNHYLLYSNIQFRFLSLFF